MLSINQFKDDLLLKSSYDFNEEALKLFKYQSVQNQIYAKYIKLLNIDPKKITNVKDIPFLPINFFKTHEITINQGSVEEVFYSSGTTGQIRSRHLIKDISFYNKMSEKAFEWFYGPLSECIIIALLPSYQSNPGSSLIFMVKHFIERTGNINSSFITFNDINTLKEILKNRSEKKLILIGVTFALLQLASENLDLNGAIIMETGGMKGKGREMAREEVHQILGKKFNVKEIHSEYGMTELFSQAYSKKDGNFETPPWMKIFIREINDPFNITDQVTSGGINVIDLANAESCAFIATEDMGRLLENEHFQIIGRIDNTEIRGCNQLNFN